jgi:AcrR family transcriptional regulator
MATMSTAPTTSPRERLLDAAIRLLGESGPEALQARRVGAEIGASTMAVYTHFGGMPRLVEAVATEGFRRFGDRLAEVAHTDDPVADLLSLGMAYRAFAHEFPQLYRLMFGLTTNAPQASTVEDLGPDATGTGSERLASFQYLLEAVRAMSAAGRIKPAEPLAVASQMWSIMHGFVLLELAGFLGTEQRSIEQVLAPMTRNFLVGLGDTPEAFERSLASVVERLSA